MAKIAVIATGGKQYVVAEDSLLNVEKLEGVAGDKVIFDNVLLVDDGSVQIGNPTVSGAKVEAEIVRQYRAPKVTVIHYKQKSRYFKKRGHRQPYTAVKILSL